MPPHELNDFLQSELEQKIARIAPKWNNYCQLQMHRDIEEPKLPIYTNSMIVLVTYMVYSNEEGMHTFISRGISKLKVKILYKKRIKNGVENTGQQNP